MINITINGNLIETDDDGYLIKPELWDEEVAITLISQHEARGFKKVTESDWELIQYFRKYYEEHLLHHLNASRAKNGNRNIKDEKSYLENLYELFPHGAVNRICKLAGLPKSLQQLQA